VRNFGFFHNWIKGFLHLCLLIGLVSWILTMSPTIDFCSSSWASLCFLLTTRFFSGKGRKGTLEETLEETSGETAQEDRIHTTLYFGWVHHLLISTFTVFCIAAETTRPISSSAPISKRKKNRLTEKNKKGRRRKLVWNQATKLDKTLDHHHTSYHHLITKELHNNDRCEP